MFVATRQELHEAMGNARPIDISIVMPCLNEAISLPHCIANARRALAIIEAQYGLFGEIVIADNGSSDGSQDLAISLGARVVSVESRGYGAALIGGCEGAYGRYLLMGDADGSYDFADGVPMIGKLLDGADFCMGSRFEGGIAPGAMPWKNRYIGNPALTGILNLFFRSGISDAHCGLRAIVKDCFLALKLSGSGMEFASEMVIKATLRRFCISEVPATLSADVRERAPHLRPWRDGWRHLRYLLMLSPTWVFGIPAALAMGLSVFFMIFALGHMLAPSLIPAIFGTSWIIVAGFLFTSGHLAAVLALATHLYGVRQGYRSLRPVVRRYASLLNLESALVAGAVMLMFGAGGFMTIGINWAQSSFAALPTIWPLVASTVLGATGIQTIFGGFMLAIIAGHDANFTTSLVRSPIYATEQ